MRIKILAVVKFIGKFIRNIKNGKKIKVLKNSNHQAYEVESSPFFNTNLLIKLKTTDDKPEIAVKITQLGINYFLQTNIIFASG